MSPVSNATQPTDSILHFCGRSIPLDPALAEVFGVNGALVIQQLHHLVRINHGREGHVFNGLTWVWETYEEWNQQFPWMSIGTVRNTLDRLVDQGIVMKAEKNPHQWRRQLYYRLDYDCLTSIMCQHGYERVNGACVSANSWQHEALKTSSSSDRYSQLETPKTGTSIVCTETSSEPSPLNLNLKKELVAS